MTYTAPDGHVIVSSPTETVSYTCTITGQVDGIYDSIETYPAATTLGIQQMQIKRTIDNGVLTIDIKESTDDELIIYIQTCQIQLEPINF